MAKVPAYQRVADALRSQIQSGDLPDGAQLPSLARLAEDYGVSTIVAQEAVRQLRGEGIVRTRPGAGTFVQLRRIVRRSPGRLARRRWSAGQAIHDHDTADRDRRAEVTVGEAPAPAFAAEALGVDPTDVVLVRTRRFVVDGRPVQLAVSYLPLELVRGTPIAYTDPGPGGTYARLAEAGYAPAKFEERVISRRPTPDELRQLEMSVTAAQVLQITRFTYDTGGRCVEVTQMVLAADQYELVYDFSAD